MTLQDPGSDSCLDQSQDDSIPPYRLAAAAAFSQVDADVGETSQDSDYQPGGESMTEEEIFEGNSCNNSLNNSQCSIEEIQSIDRSANEDSRGSNSNASSGAFSGGSGSSGGSRSEEEKRRVSVLPPLTFLQLLGCSKCSLYFGTSHGQKSHMESVHGKRPFTAEEAAFDFERLKASEGADHLIAECACIACGLFFLDPLLKKKHLAKIHPEVKHEAVRSRLPFDLSPAHTSHNHMKVSLFESVRLSLCIMNIIISLLSSKFLWI